MLFEGYSVVEGLEDEVIVEVVEGSMVVGKIVEDLVDMVAGIMVDSMVEAFATFVVDNSDFVELGWMVRYWQYKGKLGTLAEIHHGPPC